ncbi:hypothetical protein Dsin_017208 [Dipteronia sinensis]|uniref:Uncharacterized protein n=1 Tax=Dipteronia sinensis TaxID=43782 RepID=A0AAE0AFU0_9ROSI|nr:hypothetical protein Dsin_017208 [Dipteronia sinensis]
MQEKDFPNHDGQDNGDEFYDAEILDEMTTSRGELKLRTVSFNEDRLFKVHPEDGDLIPREPQ